MCYMYYVCTSMYIPTLHLHMNLLPQFRFSKLAIDGVLQEIRLLIVTLTLSICNQYM